MFAVCKTISFATLIFFSTVQMAVMSFLCCPIFSWELRLGKTVAAGDLSKLAHSSASWHGKRRISAQSHHKTTCAFFSSSYWDTLGGGIWCYPSFWKNQLLSNHSEKIGNLFEGKIDIWEVRAKLINLPYLTIRCQYVAGAELAKWSIVWYRFKVIKWWETKRAA